MREVLYDEDREDTSERRVRASASACAQGPQPRAATGPGGATTFASSSAIRLTGSRCFGSSRRRSQAALSRSYKNQCGAVMAATLRLADVRLLAGVTPEVPDW
jgi:hypothetical protein